MTESPAIRTDPSEFYAHLYERMVDDASFLWLLRSLAVNRSNYYLEDVGALDNRIQAQLDGLMSSPEQSWDLCVAALELQQPGEMFTASVIAFRSLDVKKIQYVVEAASANLFVSAGLISAMAWLPDRLVHPWIRKFLTSKDLNHKYFAVAACSLRREDPGELLSKMLARDDCVQHHVLYARLLRLVGELKRLDLREYLAPAMASENTDVRFWAVWSAVMLGDRTASAQLKPFVMQQSELQVRAVELAFRVLSIEDGRQWIGLLAKTPANLRCAIHAAGVFGDPQAVAWLIQQMYAPISTRIAGEAFSTITGLDLEGYKLALDELPDLDELLPEDQSESVDLDDDEYLPFPDMDKVSAVWQKYSQRFVPGQRYFMGKTVSAEYLAHIYAVGNQRQRRAAALELCMLQPSQCLLNHADNGAVDE